MKLRSCTFLGLIIGTFAGPILNENRCSRKCTESSNFKYEVGTNYEFDYGVITRTVLAGASEEHSSLEITAKAHIGVLSKCDFSMSLVDVRIKHSVPNSASDMENADPDREFKSTLESNRLRFSFQDGIIDQLCPEKCEPIWSLNIKRGILSMFQNSMTDITRGERVHENDVMGSCDTDYEIIQKGWYSVNIKKSKNLHSCTGRNSVKTSVHGALYRVPYSFKSLPLMKSVHDCDQEITMKGILKKSRCHEMHILRPFSKDDNGAVTESNQILEFRRISKRHNKNKGSVFKSVSLLFEYSDHGVGEYQILRDIQSKLLEICEATYFDVQPGVPRLFSHLVYIMKGLTYPKLMNVYNEVHNGRWCINNKERIRKFYLDALPMVGTSDSVRTIVKLIRQGNIVADQMGKILRSFAFIPNPSKEIVGEAISMLSMDGEMYLKKTLLPISSMVNNYCESNSDCMSNHAVGDLVTLLRRLIGVCDSSEAGKSKDLIILALRAVGNVGRSEHLVDSLLRCIISKSQTDEIRISALQAYRTLPCFVTRSDIFRIFMDSEEDSEIRITAYLVLMQCPNAEILDQIQKRMAVEEMNQVRSFVWSHLTNLLETSSPYKQSFRSILQDANIKLEFDMDKRKFSRNYEGSFFSHMYNTGAMIESNIIWSQKSFIPRSVNLNLTVDLFGTSINLLELGGRMKGLEYFLESYLGPENKFNPSDKPKDYHETHGIRMDKLETSKPKFAGSKNELKGSVYLRLFGNELQYSRFNGIGDLMNSRGKFDFLKFLQMSSKEQDLSLTENIMFIDSSFIVPTGAGIPLNLTVNGTASVIIKASGRADFRKITSSPISLHVHGSILPSAAVEVSSSMMIDAFITKTGLRMTSLFHTSSAVVGRLDLTRGEIFSLEIDTPKQKIDVFKLKSRFFIVHNKVEREQRMIENRVSKRICSSNRLKTITGLQICGEAAFPNASLITNAPYFPLTGPVSFLITIEKDDIPNGFKVVGKTIQSKEATTAQFALDTLGSETDRAISVDFVLNSKDKKLVAGLTSPWKKVAVKGSMLNSADKKSLKMTLVNEEEDVYSVEAFLNITKKDSAKEYTPLFEIKRPRARTITLKGTITCYKNKEINGEVKLIGIKDTDVDIKGKYVNTKEEKSTSATLVLSPNNVYSFVSTVTLSRKRRIVKVLPKIIIKTPGGQLFSLTGYADYRTGKFIKTDLLLQMESVLKRPITLKGNLVKTGTSRNGYKGTGFRATCSLNCQLIVFKANFNTGIRHAKKSKTVSSRFAIDYTLSTKKKNRVSFSSKLTDRSTKSLLKYTGNANLDVKRNQEYNTNLDVDVNHNNRHSEVDFKVRHGENVKDKEDKSKELYVSATVNHKINMPSANVDFTVKAVYPPKVIDYIIIGQHSNNLKSLDSSIIAKYFQDRVINMSLSLKNESKRLVKLAAAFLLDYPGREMRLSSDLTQIREIDFVHYLNIQSNKDHRNQITTSYRNPTRTLHEVTSKIELNNHVPIKFGGSVNLNVKKFKVETRIERGGQRYGVDLSSYLNDKKPSGRLTLDLICPQRRVTATVEGGRERNKYAGKFDTLWDVDRDATKRIFTNLSLNVNRSTQDTTIGGSITIASPFYPLRNISLSTDYVNDVSKYKYATKLQWDSKEFSTDILVDKPISKDNINFTFIATSPFLGYRSIYCNVDHTFKNSNLTSSLTARMEQYFFDLEAFGKLLHTKLRRDVTFSGNIKTNFKKVKIWSIDFEHADDWHNFKTNAKYRMNGKLYQFEKMITFSKVGWLIRTDGVVNVTSPDCRTIINWNYSSSRDSIKTAITTEWGYEGYKLYIGFDSTHDVMIRRKIENELVIQSPWDPVKDIKVSVLHDFGENYAKRNIYLKQDQQVKSSLVYFYKRVNNNVDLDFFHDNPYMDSISGNVNIRMNDRLSTAYLQVTWSPNRKIIFDGSLNIESKQYLDGQVQLHSTFKGFGKTVANFNHKKKNGIYITMADVEYGEEKKIEVESQLGFEYLKILKLTVKTPYPELSLFESGIFYDGDYKSFNSSANIKLIPKMENMGVQLNWNTYEDFTGRIRIECPIKELESIDVVISSRSIGKGKKCKAEIAYYNRISNKIVLDGMYHADAWTDFGAGITLDTSYKELRNIQTEFSFLYNKSKLESTFKLKTPFKQVKDTNFEVKHTHNDQQAQSYVLIKLSPVQEYSADSKLRWLDNITGNIQIKTPHSGYERTTVNFVVDARTTKVKTHTDVFLSNKKINTDLILSFADDIELRFSFVSPFPNLKNIQVQVYKHGERNNLTAKGIILFELDHKTINSSLSYSRKSDMFRVNFDLKTPYTEDIELSILHDGVIDKFNTEVLAIQGDNYNFSSSTNFNRGKGRIYSDVDIGYIFRGKGNTLFLQFSANSDSNCMSKIDLSGQFNRKSINITTSFNRDLNLTSGVIKIITPFEGYSNLGMTFEHIGETWISFKSKGTMTLKENIVYIGYIEFSAPDVEHINATIEYFFIRKNTGDTHYQLKKAHYAHNLNINHFDISSEIIYNQDKKLSGAVKVTSKPKTEFLVRLHTPFEGYKTLQAFGSYSNVVEIHEVSGQFLIGSDSFVKVNCTIELTSVPVDIFFLVETPYSGFEKVIVRGNHQGDHTQFKTSISFDSSNTSLVTSSIDFSFSSPNEMVGFITFRSRFKKFSDIKLSLLQSVQNGYRKKRVEIRWAPEKQILLDGSYKWHHNWRGLDASGELLLETPFMILGDFKVKGLHNHAVDLSEIVDEALAEYNGKGYLDLFSRFSAKKGGPHTYSMDINEPKPMALSLSGKLHKDDMYVDCFVNWDKNNSDSNARLITIYKTKLSFLELERFYKLKLVHPARTLGFEGNFKNTGRSYKNRAMFTWDQKQGNTFSYDIEMENKTERFADSYMGRVKLGVPMRSIQLTCGYSNKRGSTAYKTSFFWDADKDLLKRISTNVVLKRGAPLNRLQLSLNLPSVDKKYQVSSEMSRGISPTLFYGKSVFSYHKNPKRNLILLTKIEDIGMVRGEGNYTLLISVIHPVSGVDFAIAASAGNNQERTTSGVHLTYLAADRLKKNIVIQGEINKLRKTIEVEVLTPIKSMSARVEAQSGNPYRLKLNNIYDNRKHVTTELSLDSKEKYINLFMQFNPDNKIRAVNIKGRFVNSTLIELDILRQSARGQNSDVTAVIRLNTSNVLHARLTWRPIILAEIQRLISEKMEIYSYNVNQFYGLVSRTIGDEIREKYNVLVQEISQELQFISKVIGSEFKSMEGQLNTMKVELRRFYERNDLHIRDVGDTMNDWFEEVQVSYREFVEKFEIFYKELEKAIGEMKSGLRRYPFIRTFNEFIFRVAGIVKNFQNILVDSINDLMYRYDERSAALYAKYRSMSRHVSRMVKETMNVINTNIHVRSLREKYCKMKDKLKYFQRIKMERLWEVLDKAIQSSLPPDGVETYKSVVINTKHVLKAQIEDLMDFEEFNQLYNISKDVYEQTLWAYSYWKFEDKIKNVVEIVFDLGKKMMFHDLIRLKDNLLNLKKSRVIVLDKQRGELQVEIYLPVPLDSLAESPLHRIKKYVATIQRAVTKYLPSRNTTFWGVYYKYSFGRGGVQELLPPFKTYASVLGNKHFITFDKKHFDFVGKCSYVLTRDMVDDNFTVILNYDKRTMQKSFMVLFKGLTIEVFSNYQVIANDRKVELPFVSESVTIFNNFGPIEIDNGFGLKIDWDIKYEIFTVGLPGWYFAKTAGLLGTYDNEDFNDLMTNQRNLTDSINAFTSSWEIGRRRCLTTNFAHRAETPDIPVCRRLFVDSESPFKRCFEQVDPTQFHKLCQQYAFGKNLQQGSCRAARQYIRECKNLEVYLYLPSECVTCEGPDGVFNQYSQVELSADSNDTAKRVKMSADAVFIVEENQCNSEPIKVLPRLVTELEQKFKLNGLGNNRYGLIGYGGERPLDEEHVVTIDNFPFGKSNEFLKGIENLRLGNSSTQAQSLAAIRMATRYPYRIGVAKILVLMPCSMCPFDFKYLDLNDVIRSEGFTLHIIKVHQLQLSHETLKDAHIFGFDANQVYGSQEKHNPIMVDSVDKPNDMCSRLAIQSRGGIFDIKQMVTKNARIQKQFMSDLLHSIGKSSIPHGCQTCKCEVDGYLRGLTICKPCDNGFLFWNYIPKWWGDPEND